VLNLYALVGDSVRATFFRTATGVRSINLVNRLPLFPDGDSNICAGDTCQVTILRLTDDKQAYVVKLEKMLSHSADDKPYLLNLLTPRNAETDDSESFTFDVLRRLALLPAERQLEQIFNLVEFDTMLIRKRSSDIALNALYPVPLHLPLLVEVADDLIAFVHRDSLRAAQVARLRMAAYLARARQHQGLYQSLIRCSVPNCGEWLPGQLYFNLFDGANIEVCQQASARMLECVNGIRPEDGLPQDVIKLMRANAHAVGKELAKAKQILQTIDVAPPLSLLFTVCIALGHFEDAHHYLTEMILLQEHLQ